MNVGLYNVALSLFLIVGLAGLGILFAMEAFADGGRRMEGRQTKPRSRAKTTVQPCVGVWLRPKTFIITASLSFKFMCRC